MTIGGPVERTPTLDHLGWIGPDLNQAAQAWERLGFKLCRQSPQMGFTGPGGTLEPWASANRCVLFKKGYLELIGLTDPKRHNPWTEYLARGAGPHIAAFRTDVADAAFPEIAARVDGFDPPVQRRRMAPLGLDPAGGETEMRFRNIFSQDSAWPEGRFIVIEHQTPEALWQAELLDHPNGAEALLEAIFTAPAPQSTADRLSRLLDRPAEKAGDGFALEAAGGGKLSVMTPEDFATRFPGADTAPDRPAVAGAVISATRLDALPAGLEHSTDGALFAHGPASVGGVIAFKPI